MEQITIDKQNLIQILENIWETLATAAHKAADLEQDLIKHGYSEPLTPQQLNELLENKSPKEAIREAIRITLECRKMAVDKPGVKEAKCRIGEDEHMIGLSRDGDYTNCEFSKSNVITKAQELTCNHTLFDLCPFCGVKIVQTQKND